jgi:hypothetical protein
MFWDVTSCSMIDTYTLLDKYAAAIFMDIVRTSETSVPIYYTTGL